MPAGGRSMFVRIRIILACLVILAPAASHAAGSDEARARQELDQELHALVKIPAPRLSLTIEPAGPEGMVLDTVTARLDGKVVHLGGAAAGPGITSVRLWSGTVAPGPHQVSLEVTWDRQASYGRHFEITLAGGLRLTAQKGLAVDVRTRLAARPKVEDPQHHYRLAMRATPTMLARVDSTDLPPPPKARLLAFAPDGGTGDAGARKMAAGAADGGTVALAEADAKADAGHPARVVARAAPPRPHPRHRIPRRHPRPRLHASRAAFAPSASPPAKAAAPAAPAPPAPAARADTAAPPAAPAKAAAPRAPAAPPPTAPAATPPPQVAEARHGRLLALVLGAAGALALLVAGLIFLRR